MMGRTHLTTGVTAGALFAAVMPVDPLARAAFIAVTAYATLLPDFDHQDAKIVHMLGMPGSLISWTIRGWPIDWYWRIWRWTIIDVQTNLLPWDIDHRGVTHDPSKGPAVFAVVLGVPTFFLPGWFGWHWWLWTLAVFVGCLTHLWGDARTLSGIPVGGGRWWARGEPFRTGSEDEAAYFEWYYRPAAIASCAICAVSTVWMLLP